MLTVIRTEYPISHGTSVSDLTAVRVVACLTLLQEDSCRRDILNLDLLSNAGRLWHHSSGLGVRKLVSLSLLRRVDKLHRLGNF